MEYDLTTPCAKCPFRSDIRPFITAARVREILTSDGEFPCHMTLDYSGDDEDGEGRETKHTKHCAGALICRERDNAPSQMMRICERIGMYDPSKLKMDAPVYRGVRDAIRAHQKKRA